MKQTMTTNFQNWFIYDGEQVQGPFSAEHLLEASRKIPNHKMLVVSRVGLDRWYPLSQLEHLLGQTTAPITLKPLDKEELKASVERKLQEISRTTAVPTPVQSRKFEPFQQTITKVEPAKIAATIEQDLARQTFAGAEQAEPVATPKTAIASPGSLSYSPAFNYVVLRARLRLGELRSPFVAGMILGMFTFGLYWVIWYRNCVRELSWHMHNATSIKGYPSSLFALIPIAHMMMAYYLAELIRDAENQNQYRRTSPMLAAILGIFPPFAMCYLQSSLNYHWKLHVQHQR